MNDKLDHFVLEYDDASGNALLAMTEGDGSLIADGAGLPYALARGYDANARTWESIEPFDDVTRAKLHYEKACGREYVPTGGKDATEKRDPQLICAKAQAAAAKSATAEGDAGGKKL